MAGINSVKLKKGGTTKTVQVGSKAYDKYRSQGYSVVKGTEKNTPKSGSKVSYSSSSSTSSKASTSSGATPAQQAQLQTIRDSLTKIRDELQRLVNAKSGGITAPAPSSGGGSSSPSYTGGSIVDYLGSQGQASDFASRSKLAQQYGISNYTGTAAQNTQLLNTLRAGSVSSNGINTTASTPSSVVTSGPTTADVLNKRKQLEEIKTKALSLQDQLNFLKTASESDPFQLIDEQGKKLPLNPLKDPDTLIAKYFNGEDQLTSAQKERDRLLGEISGATDDFYGNREKAIKNAYKEFGVDEKQTNLAQIQKEMADRQVKLRNDTQALENNAEFRGVSREFANDQRERVKSDASFDLANLAIVESAYAGDFERSRALAEDLVDQQFNAFTGQVESYKAQLQALMPQLDADQKKQALAIELALDERARLINQAKEDASLKYEYATLAAEMNAPLSVTKSILNATSADEAFMLAAPYMNERNATTTAATGATRGGTSSASVGGYNLATNPAGDVSPFNSPLSKIDLQNAKYKDLEAGVRAQFSPDFSARLFSVLTQEQLRDFMIKYDAYQRSLGQNTDPNQALEEYLQYIGKSGSSSGGGSSDIYSEIDQFQF